MKIILDLEILIAGNVECVVLEFGGEADLVEDEPNHPEVARDDVFDANITGGDCCEAREAPDLEVVRSNAVFAAPELFAPLDLEDVGADALDASAHADEHPTEALDVRLAGGILDASPSFGDRSRHDGIFRSRDRRLVHEDVGSVELVGFEGVSVLLDVDVGSQLPERQKVGVDTPTTDDVPSGWR